MTGKYISKISSEDKYLYQIVGIDSKTNNEAWWIIRVFVEKEVVFSNIIKKGNLRLSEYGEILERGFSKTIPEHILDKYGFK